jgi:hypothetical protein
MQAACSVPEPDERMSLRRFLSRLFGKPKKDAKEEDGGLRVVGHVRPGERRVRRGKDAEED